MMNIQNIVAALRDQDARVLPEGYFNPVGDVELGDEDLKSLAGGGTANTYCRCYSAEGSCGRVCTVTGECPITTWICC